MLSAQLFNIALGIAFLSAPILSQDSNSGFPAFPSFPEGSKGVQCSGSNCKVSSSSSSGAPGSQGSFDANEARRRIQESMNPNGNFGSRPVATVDQRGDGSVPRVVAPSGQDSSRGNQDGPIRTVSAAAALSATALISMGAFVSAMLYIHW